MKIEKLQETVLRFSRFCHILPYNSGKEYGYAFFHSLNMGIVFLSGEWDSIIESFRYGKSLKLIWEQFEFSEQEFENLKNLIETLVIEQMLVSIHYDENEEIKEICNDYLIGPTVNLMYLVLTDQCNYGCSYCFVEGVINEDHKFSFMTPQMAKNVLICLLIGAPELSQRINPYFSMGENPC